MPCKVTIELANDGNLQDIVDIISQNGAQILNMSCEKKDDEKTTVKLDLKIGGQIDITRLICLFTEQKGVLAVRT